MGLVVRPLLLTVLFCWLGVASAGSTIILKDLQGNAHPLARSENKLTLIHFWASWCVPCRHELPQLIDVAGELEDKGVKLILVAADSHAAVMQYVKQHQLEAEVLLDQYGSALRKYKVRALPATIIFDRQGKVVASEYGARDWRGARMTTLLSGLLR